MNLGMTGTYCPTFYRKANKDFWSIFMPIFKDFREAKPVEIPMNQVSFLRKGTLTLSDLGGGADSIPPPHTFSFIRFSLFAGCLKNLASLTFYHKAMKQ